MTSGLRLWVIGLYSRNTNGTTLRPLRCGSAFFLLPPRGTRSVDAMPKSQTENEGTPAKKSKGNDGTAQDVPVVYEMRLLAETEYKKKASQHAKTPLAEVPDDALAAEVARRNLQVLLFVRFCGRSLRSHRVVCPYRRLSARLWQTRTAQMPWRSSSASATRRCACLAR